MRSIISKLPKSLRGVYFPRPFSGSRAPTADEKRDGSRDAGAQPRTSVDAAQGTKPQKLSARERLENLSSFRISFDAISFSLSASNRRGGKANVVQATIRKEGGNDEIVAVKKLKYHEGMEIQKFSNEFVHEVELLAGLSHQHVVRLIGFVEELELGEVWIVLSWQPNGNVSEFLATGEWEIPERVSLIKDTFEGLTYLHSHQPPICHGDLKSLNILVNSSYRAIITDFGSARLLDDLEDIFEAEYHVIQAGKDFFTGAAKIQAGAAGNQLTLTGPAWSLRWAPPEVMYGATPDLSSDIWSAGWICWEIMTNKVPFPELNSEGVITLTVIQGNVPSAREDAVLSQITGLCSLMTDCWAFDPQDRPSIVQCRNEVAWMPSTPPSGAKVPSLELLLQMGRLHFSQDRHDKAASHFGQAVAVARLAGDLKAEAKALKWLASANYLQNKDAEAKETFIQAQQIFARIGDDPGRAETLQRLGDLYRSETKYSDAEESFIQARQIYARIGDDQGLANTLQGLGNLYCSQNKYSEAEESLVEAQQIYTQIGSEQGRANALRGLGKLYHIQTKYSEAEESLIQAQKIYSRIGNELGRANAIRRLGSLYRSQAKYPLAEEYFIQAQQIFTRIGNDLGVANGLRGLGDLYLSQSRYSEAEESFTQAQQIYSRIGDVLGQAYTLRGLGNLQRAQGRNVESAAFHARARDLYVRIGGIDDKEGRSR